MGNQLFRVDPAIHHCRRNHIVAVGLRLRQRPLDELEGKIPQFRRREANLRPALETVNADNARLMDQREALRNRLVRPDCVDADVDPSA